MDLDLNEEQLMLRDTARRICEARFAIDAVRALEDASDKLNGDFWAELGASGLCGLRIDQAYGGAGMEAVDLALVCEEFGRALASSPFLASCIHSAGILAASAPEELRRQWLSPIATGEAIIVPAWQENDLGTDHVPTRLDRRLMTLSGEKSLVPFASIADRFLVHAAGEGGHWVLVPGDADGVSVEAQSNYASQPLFAVRFEDVAVESGWIFDAPNDALAADSLDDVLIAVAAEAVGAADRLLALTTDYANQRHQFERPIAAFQAVSHPLAECATELEGARYLVYQAAWARDGGMPHRHLAQMAKLKATKLFRRLATVSVQVHGGIGYSSEGEPQLFYRRSKFHELMYGTAAELRKRIADHVFA